MGNSSDVIDLKRLETNIDKLMEYGDDYIKSIAYIKANILLQVWMKILEQKDAQVASWDGKTQSAIEYLLFHTHPFEKVISMIYSVDTHNRKILNSHVNAIIRSYKVTYDKTIVDHVNNIISVHFPYIK